jgi:hypothetical protein
MDPIDNFMLILKRAAEEAGRDLTADLNEVAQYASERATHLSTLVAAPDFWDAVVAERDNVALKAGIKAVNQGDQVDARLLGIVQGALAMAAQLLAR